MACFAVRCGTSWGSTNSLRAAMDDPMWSAADHVRKGAWIPSLKGTPLIRLCAAKDFKPARRFYCWTVDVLRSLEPALDDDIFLPMRFLRGTSTNFWPRRTDNEHGLSGFPPDTNRVRFYCHHSFTQPHFVGSRTSLCSSSFAQARPSWTLRDGSMFSKGPSSTFLESNQWEWVGPTKDRLQKWQSRHWFSGKLGFVLT